MTANIQPYIRYGLGLNLEYTGDIEGLKDKVRENGKNY